MCGSKCEAKYKIENCLKKSTIKVFSLNDHIFDHNAAEDGEKKYGLTKSMKNFHAGIQIFVYISKFSCRIKKVNAVIISSDTKNLFMRRSHF